MDPTGWNLPLVLPLQEDKGMEMEIYLSNKLDGYDYEKETLVTSDTCFYHPIGN